MNKLILFLAFLGLISALIVYVECVSPPMCIDACKDPCPQMNCKCGTYRDSCNCCDLCRKCAGENCMVIAGELCEEGYTCGDPNRSLIHIYNDRNVTCIPKKS
ncbi:unnamed protein product [Larinioides sclopetarius]|uniref:IGFBP N-terminal domain-containing protein n=1 Tax=Larinioides sclopetarius TaxID=280406 RepID=A0AAV1Z7E8_9ARAC